MIDIILGLVFLCLSGLIFFLVKDFPKASVMEGLGPGILPIVLINLHSLLALVLNFTGILNRKKKITNPESETSLSLSVIKSPMILLITVFFYLIALHYLGFTISTPFLVLASMKIMGSKTLPAIIMAFLLTGVIYIFFAILFRVSLPHGILL
ncbi:MAG: tripartite tricarboxylate transporter TctB family protein [Ignavibacteria bacterium]|nr:tripartite tricarboxylate transporter TctB family protein [Ignavibacteria bacterium]